MSAASKFAERLEVKQQALKKMNLPEEKETFRETFIKSIKVELESEDKKES